MDTPSYVILSRLGAQLRATQVLAHNLANAETPAFQAGRPIFAQYLQPQHNATGGRGPTAYVMDRATWRDTTPGALTTTGNPLDVAIRGEGYFAVETPQGERYTRAGRFTLGPDGRLTDMEGHAVLDARGTPLTFGPNDTRIEIQGDGTVRSENGIIGQLRVVRFEDQQRLRAEGDRLFASDDPAQPVERPSLVQGAFEGSNVRPVLELTNLTAELREFQFAVQFIEREGERLGSAVDRILRRRT